ncbi:MAG: amidase [Lautropia sp.]
MTPPDDDAWWRLSAVALGQAYRERRYSPPEVVDACYTRIARIDPPIGAFVALCREQALAQARDSARRFAAGAPLGPLDGIPFAAKDNLCCDGLATTWGSPSGRDHHAPDEPAVARLRAAGAILVGKTNVPEFTLEGYTSNPLFGTTRNPWNLALTPGGSSGGSVAALAAGMVPLAIGTDGGGSIRRPASHTGVVGLKPSIGAIAREGGLPQLLLDFEVIGPMARHVADLRLLFDAMAGPLPGDRASIGAHAARTAAPPMPARLRIAYVPTIDDAPVDPQVAASCRRAVQRLAALGHEVREQPMPLDVSTIAGHWPTIGQVGLAWLFAAHPAWGAHASARYLEMAAAGARVPAPTLWAVLDAVTRLRRDAAALFTRVDLVVTPAAAALPWPTDITHPPTIDGRPVGPRGHAIFTGWVNAAGLPAIAMPCEPSAEGLPIGLQLIADYGRDDALLALGEAMQAQGAQCWRWPPAAGIAS